MMIDWINLSSTYMYDFYVTETKKSQQQTLVVG